MIQISSNSNPTTTTKNPRIWSLTTKPQPINLTSQLQKLYQSAKFQDRTLYNVRLYRQNNGGELVKNRLDARTMHYITWCYLVLNWEYLSTENLATYLNNLPTSQSQPQQIRIQSNMLKISKNNKCLSLNLHTHSMSLTDNLYFLDSYNRKGTSQLLEYEPSLCQLTINSMVYRFDGLIRAVESCEGFVAVVTGDSLYIVGLKDGNMANTRFGIEDCMDVKWGKRGLYYLQSNGNLGLLERQTTFLPTKNRFSQHTTLQISAIKNKQYLARRLAITNPQQMNSNVIILAQAQSNPKKLLLQVVNSSNYGMRPQYLPFELKNISGDVMYKNLISGKERGEIIMAVVSGKDGKVQQYHEYRFGTA